MNVSASPKYFSENISQIVAVSSEDNRLEQDNVQDNVLIARRSWVIFMLKIYTCISSSFQVVHALNVQLAVFLALTSYVIMKLAERNGLLPSPEECTWMEANINNYIQCFNLQWMNFKERNINDIFSLLIWQKNDFFVQFYKNNFKPK